MLVSVFRELTRIARCDILEAGTRLVLIQWMREQLAQMWRLVVRNRLSLRSTTTWSKHEGTLPSRTAILGAVQYYQNNSCLATTRLCISEQLRVLHQSIMASFFQAHTYLNTFVDGIVLDIRPAWVYKNIAFELGIRKPDGFRNTKTEIVFLVYIHALPARARQVHTQERAHINAYPSSIV